MLSLKEFQKSMKAVPHEDIDARRSKGAYVQYIEALIKQADSLPAGKSVEVDIQDAKKAVAFAAATRTFLKRAKRGSFVVGNFKTSVFCGKRSSDSATNGGN